MTARKWALVASLGIATVGSLVWIRTRSTDPTRFGPERTLTLEQVSLVKTDGGHALFVRGRSNLPDGARIQVEILATESVFTATADCRQGVFAVEQRESARIVTAGQYVVVAEFSLEAQSNDVRTSLRHQPRHLEARAPLRVETGNAAPELTASFEALIDRANRASTAAEVTKVTTDVAAFDERLWISRLRPAVRHLRRSLEAAGMQPTLNTEALRREVTRAQILSSF